MPTQKPPYFSGQISSTNIPLSRYLPPYNLGTLPKMLKEKGINSGWILDPLGSQPLAAIDLATHGYQVFVSSNNPILTLITEVISMAPSQTEWNAALSELGSIRIRGERLETFLQKPFKAQCPKCNRFTYQVRFVWHKETNQPIKKHIDCPFCETKFEEIPDSQDLENLNKIGNTALHQSRAIQRIFSNQEPFPQTLQFIQEAYTQRALSFIVTLFNHLDGLTTSPHRKKMLELLITTAFDHATTLWPDNQFNTRPRQIVTPNEFLEVNLWEIMEKTAHVMSRLKTQVSFVQYPESPPTDGGICLYANRYREHEIENLPDFQAVATVLPRPNQALWSLSSIWSGWLWGNQSALQIKSALTRQRYDWYWLTNALKMIFSQLSQNIKWVALAPELTPGYSVSYLAAASANGFRLTDFAFSPYEKTAQFYWDKSYAPIAIGTPPTQDKMLIEYLENKGDSANYSELFNYYIVRATSEGLILKSGIIPDINLYTNIQKRFESNLKNTDILVKIDQDSMQFGDYWLKNPSQDQIPHVDQVESLFYQFAQQDQFSENEIKHAIDKQMPSYLPAPIDWLKILLISYCSFDPNSNAWRLKTQEQIPKRQQDKQELISLLEQLGNKLSMIVTRELNGVVWKNNNDQFQFFITPTSNLCQFRKFLNPGYHTVVLYPGSRALLLAEKIKQNILYKTLCDNLHPIKYRHIRKFALTTQLDTSTFITNLDLDPALGKEYEQLSMF